MKSTTLILQIHVVRSQILDVSIIEKNVIFCTDLMYIASRASNDKERITLFDSGASFSVTIPKIAADFRAKKLSIDVNAGTADAKASRHRFNEHVELT